MEARVETESVAVADPASDRVDLNRAGAAELQTLPGIGPKLAARIISHREANGPFLFEEDITQVPGLGAGTFGRLADQLMVTLPSSTELSSAEPPSLADTYGRFAEGLDLEADVEALAVTTATEAAEANEEEPAVAVVTASVEAIRVPPPDPFDEEGLEAAPGR